MICIYEKTETSFTYNGLGTLEPTYCSFSPFINDVWQLEMYLPYDPEGKYKLVENGRILKVTGIDCIQEQTSDYQLFSIETYRKEGNSIYVLAYPVGMDARFDTYANQVNANYKTASEAIALINAVKAITLNNQEIDKYTVSTDISSSSVKSEVWNNTNIIAMLTDDEKGFIHKWGGEVCYDNYNIKVNESLGRTTGSSEVRYGKNIRGMSYEEDSSQVITRLYPIANSGEILNAISAYKIADSQYVDASNVLDYSIPHIGYTTTPYNLVQLSDDGSAAYATSIAQYTTIKENATAWLSDALFGQNTGGADGLLINIELGWFQDNYALTMDNDGTEGLAEYVTNKICSDSTRPIYSASVKNLIYTAIKDGFAEIFENEGFTSTKKMWQTFYSYTWDSSGAFRVNINGEADYAWVYSSNKWHQLNDEGYTTGAVDSATWKWYKVSGKSYKRFGNKKKKRYLKNQWWCVNNIWYWFEDNGEGDTGASLQADCYDMFDSISVSSKTIYELLSPICKSAEDSLFNLLYHQMTNYCSNRFATEKISYPTPSISIDMIDLSKTVEYAGYESLLKVKLGDTVKCVNNKLNIYTDLRVTGLTYDVIKKCNTSIQIGLTESSIISKFDKLGNINDTSWQKNGLIAGDGIKIDGNIISATGVKVTDVVVKNQSVVYGGKAVIDIDELSGEGLQWFEETEDALFGYADVQRLIDDPEYKITGETTATLQGWRNGEDTGKRLSVTVSNTDALMMYYPYNYASKSTYICSAYGEGYIDNDGAILVLSKNTDNIAITCIVTGGSGSRTSNFNMNTVPLNEGRYHISGGLAGYGEYVWKTRTEIDGDTWYGLFILDDVLTFENHSNFRSTLDYISVADYPTGHPYQDTQYNVAYDTTEEAVRAVALASKEITGGNFNGISREGKLAFFAGADDEHGTNAPVKIYTDGTYEGLDKIVDFQIDGTSNVTNKIASVNTMVGATSSTNGTKGLVPRPTSTNYQKFLRGDGTWATPASASDMQGATASANGVHGLVPAPLIANKDQFLKGDGTWATPTDTQYSDFNGSTHGLVPAPSSGDSGYLKVDGTWDEPEGTTVIANPTGTATDDLTKLQVGEDIYNVQNQDKITEIIDDSTFASWFSLNNNTYTHIYFYQEPSPIIAFRKPSSYSYDDDMMVIYTIPIPITTKKVVVRFDTETSNRGYNFCCGFKTTLNTERYCRPADTDWVYVKSSNDANESFEWEYDISTPTPLYLYFWADSWDINITSIQITEQSGGGASDLSDLGDVSISSATNGQILKYDGTLSKWINASGGGGGSTVTITPRYNRGTEIATFTIDGVTGKIYLPVSPLTYTNSTNVQAPVYDPDAESIGFVITPTNGYEGITFRIPDLEASTAYTVSFTFRNNVSSFGNYAWRCELNQTQVSNYNVTKGTDNLPKTTTPMDVTLTGTSTANGELYLVFYLPAASGNGAETITNLVIEEVV